MEICFSFNVSILTETHATYIHLFTGISNENYFVVNLLLKQAEYKETEQIRAFDFIDLLVNIGGYIGMFLGYGLLNIADTLIWIAKSITQKDEVIT